MWLNTLNEVHKYTCDLHIFNLILIFIQYNQCILLKLMNKCMTKPIWNEYIWNYNGSIITNHFSMKRICIILNYCLCLVVEQYFTYICDSKYWWNVIIGHEICFEMKKTNIKLKSFIILFIQNKYTIISFITLRNPYIHILNCIFNYCINIITISIIMIV